MSLQTFFGLAKKPSLWMLALAFCFAISFPNIGLASPSQPLGHGPRIHLKNGTSTNWSGYAVETNLATPQNNAVSDVKGGWTVPAVTCSAKNAYSSTWVGIDGYSDNTVEQIGTDSDCYKGAPRYYAWFEMYPKMSKNIGMAVKAGDTINAEVKYNGNGSYVLMLKDVTANTSFSTTQKSPKAHRQSAEWIVEAPSSGGILPLANFGTEQITNALATINGLTGTISNGAWQNDAITMVNSSGQPKAIPSALSTDGSSFSVIWKSN